MDDLITKLAQEAGLGLCMHNPPQLTDMGDGTIQLRSPPGLTPHGEKLRRFAALVANECSTIVMSHQLPRGTEWCDVREEFAAAIRAKFKEPTNG